MTGRGRCQEEALGAPCHLLTADILAQNALGLFHRCLQTKYWLLEGWGRGLSPRGSWVSQPHPRPHARPGTRVTSSACTCCSIRWCSSGSTWKAWGVGVWEAGAQVAVRRAGEEDSGVQAAGVGWGLGSPPAGTAAARTPPSHGWARAFPGGAGQCRGPPRRAGPADTQQGHLRDPRPPSARSKPHQQPLAPTPHAPGRGTRPPHV